jgi:hypothetical protein
VSVPTAPPRRDGFRAPEPNVEIRIADPGFLPVHAVVPADGVTDDLVRRLEALRRDLPRLETGEDTGGVDIRLDIRDGRQLKHGSVVLIGGDGRPHPIAIDATTRRFRLGGLPAGEYKLRAASAGIGSGAASLVVRRGDITRTSVLLVGPAPSGEATLRFVVHGTKRDNLQMRVTDRDSGKVVAEERIVVADGRATLTLAQAGRFHLDILDFGAKSCYDVDADDPSILQLFPPLELDFRLPIPEPDPPDWPILPEELQGMTEVLPRLGIQSMDALAGAEPEALLHQARSIGAPIHTRLLAASIDAAQRHTGVAAAAGVTRIPLRVASERSLTTAFRLEQAGTVDFEVDLGPGGKADVILEGPAGKRTIHVDGKARLQVNVAPEQAPNGGTVTVTVANRTAVKLAGSLVATVVGVSAGSATIVGNPIEERIAHIYQAVALYNPGISTSVNPAVMAPENIRMWLDHARTIMNELGVCSFDDLGKLRIEPNQLLKPGAYIAPPRKPLGVLAVPPLAKYAFAGIINDTILHYVPNEVLHKMAVIIGGEWDIRGDQIIIGKDVRELLVIVKSIGYDAASSITWETPVLPVAHTYWPATAGNGGNGTSWGQDGERGQDGDPNPSAQNNGGPSAVTPAPIVTMYILDTTGNLPPIDLGGQDGGDGGLGQNGGNGGNGHEGLRAEGTFFGGCCRGVGFGGKGGKAGDGGRGGPGGKGGEGGKITLLTTPPGIIAMEAAPPAIDINPGEGGDGGPPGAVGSPGQGGPAGTADCEIYCDEHPERAGVVGDPGVPGQTGKKGGRGPGPVSDAFQIIPITEAEWNEAFNNPHIFELAPPVVEPGDYVTVHGANFDPDLDHVFFDGEDMGNVFNTTDVVFQVPETAEGGYHPVVIRPPEASKRRSNKAQLHVLPKFDSIPDNTRWNEGDEVTLTGLAFRSGCSVLAEDWSTDPVTSFTLPTDSVTRTEITLTIPNGPLMNLRGVRRILVRNPSGGTTLDERTARIGDTIIVSCAVFRAVGQTTGVTTAHSVSEIAALFTEGNTAGVGAPWGQARIAFVLAQPVKDITVPDADANVWPNGEAGADSFDAALATEYVPAALNFIFAKDVEESTAYAWYGGGPLAIGDEPGQVLSAGDLRHVVAHEIGHALCLAHVCDIGDDADGGFFGRDCSAVDVPFLMHPNWGPSEEMILPPEQIDGARIGATHFETGKTSGLALSSLFQGRDPLPSQCMTADTED